MWLWNKIKWFGNELLKIGSNSKSFFSKKRVESGIAFVLAQMFMIIYFFSKYNTMDVYDFVVFIAVEFAVAGYMINHIQKEKSLDKKEDEQ